MIRITTDVFCDKCAVWIHGGVSHKPQHANARKTAKADGWKRLHTDNGMEDICPKCAGLTEDDYKDIMGT